MATLREIDDYARPAAVSLGVVPNIQHQVCVKFTPALSIVLAVQKSVVKVEI
jgi:hypothetical protein